MRWGEVGRRRCGIENEDPPTGSGGKNSLNFSVNIGTVFLNKTRVGFGRTELSIRLSCTEFCALSSGHGPRGLGFQGGSSRMDFHVFQGGSKIREKIVYTSQTNEIP